MARFGLLGLRSARSLAFGRFETEEARALFVAGSAAVEGGRWSDAVDSFERAYALGEDLRG